METGNPAAFKAGYRRAGNAIHWKLVRFTTLFLTAMIKKFLSMALVAVCVTLLSCDEDDDQKLTSEQSKAVEDQSATEAYFNEAGDLSTQALSSPEDEQISGGRTKENITITVEGDTRFNGATITLTVGPNNNALNPQGTITIDFGAGQTDPSGTVRKGKILVAYNGWRFLPGSKIELTFQGYEVNGVKLEGKRTVTTTALAQNSITFEVRDDDGKATFTDGTFVTREALHTSKWTIGNSAATTTWTIEGSANGQTRERQPYTATVQSPIIFKLECALSSFVAPAQGVLAFTVGTTAIQVDYGTGTCDNKATVSVGGFSQEISVGE